MPDISALDGNGGPEHVIPYELREDPAVDTPEADREAEAQGPDENHVFWQRQIRAAMLHERRFRSEGDACERQYFGQDNDPGSVSDPKDALLKNAVGDDTMLIHGTIEVLKPLVYSDTPKPIVSRRFKGDGAKNPTAMQAGEAAQRLAAFAVDTQDFDAAMESIRDDWLIPGRGVGRVFYHAQIDEAKGIKTSEEVKVRHQMWRRVLFAPSFAWEEMPWIAFETHMTRSQVKRRFDPLTEEGKAPISEQVSYNRAGLSDRDRAEGDDETDNRSVSDLEYETGTRTASPFDTTVVWEIWVKDSREVVWYCPDYKGGLLDKEADPLGLEHFYPMPRPLLATTRGTAMTPRPDMRYYEQRAKEAEEARKKLKTILDAISVSGLFPGQMVDEVKKLLNGRNEMIAVPNWIALMEKGGTNNIIQWLPLDAMVNAMNALIVMREQAKAAMFEGSGVSDIMRAQGDPNETATAQQIKGRYAGLRLQIKQKRMAVYCRDMIRLMLEVMVEHFDTASIAEICQLELPLTEVERQMMAMQVQQAEAQYAQAMQLAQMAQQSGLDMPMPPKPDMPDVPETSWELVHAALRDDLRRKIIVDVETDSTVLADQQADKEARIEFLTAIGQMVQNLGPLIAGGMVPPATIKELLMFGVRGFAQGRTLESLIEQIPDKPEDKGPPPEDTAITVAKIRAEVDRMLKEMDLGDREKDRAHEITMKGADGIVKAAEMQHETELASANRDEQHDRETA